jgi:hypothetical protein
MLSRSEITGARPGRAAHLRSRLLRPLPIFAPVATFLLIVIGGGATSSAAVAALVVLGGVVVVAIRSSRRHARRDFFDSYTRSRGLELDEYRELADVAPLLRTGDRRYAEQVMTGVLPGGVQGVLALYTYETKRGGEDVAHTQLHRFTVVMHWLPHVVDRVSELYCVPRSGGSSSGVDAPSRNNRLELESVALDRRYEISFGPGEDANWLRRLFSPSFIVWLCEQKEPGFGFQLASGHLCVFTAGHNENAADLDALCQAAAFVGTRLAEEVAE